jgi:hypothetical protein
VGLQNPGGRAWHADRAYPRLLLQANKSWPGPKSREGRCEI